MSFVLTEFQRGRIVGAREAGATIAEICKLVGVSKATVCRVMREFMKGKTSPNNSTERNKKLDSRGQRSLKRIVKADRRISATKATVALNNCLKQSKDQKGLSTTDIPQTVEKTLIDEWHNIPLEEIRRLYESIPRRIQAVLAANGGPTPY
ncbi:uncharacterized protein LOC129716999 [Wyeomyia smithii]|uniref:uncharacterized protein LOC129716999 n=1 Tax=Wyeomyia smithii TaxID=174621 RepID=UPI002467B4CC|nr:uncharacterized protein LOC129716999 [Wyeomyia smithii]